MAELSKKMNFKNASSVTTQAKLYSTTSEAGAEYQTLKVDGITAYVSVGATSDSNATSGRFKKSGTTKAYLKQGGIPYTEMKWTTPGTYTWTCPSGVTKVRACVIGGGGGCISSTIVGHNANAYLSGSSKFGSLTATGGGNTDTLAEIVLEEFNINTNTCKLSLLNNPSSAGTPNGNNVSMTTIPTIKPNEYGYFAGADGFSLDFSLTKGPYGAGSATKLISVDITLISSKGYGASSGGKNIGDVSVTPNQTYTVVVGDGGGLSYESESQYFFKVGSTKGNSGAVLIAYGGDIK